jgi:uncharacterized membrane protein YagU involved in acid resistance
MNVLVSQTGNLVKAKLIRALVGGFVGTVLFTLMGQFVAPNVIGQPMDVAALLAPALGGSHTAGVIAHFVTGTVVFPIAYLILGLRYLPGPAWLRGAIFLIPLYLIAMVVIMPILGQGFFFSSPPKAMVALMGHVVFGLAMGAIIGKPANQ